MQRHFESTIQKGFDLPLRQTYNNHSRRSSKTTYTPIMTPHKDYQPSPPEPQKQMQVDDYNLLELSYQHKLKHIEDNIQICKQKSKIKDKEMLSLADNIQKTSKKIDNQEHKAKKKQKVLTRISLKCQKMTQLISTEQQKIKKQTIYLHEQTSKCNSLEEMIDNVEHNIRQLQYELERRQKIYESLQGLQQNNQQLKQHYHQLLNQQKLIEYREEQDEHECREMQKKIEHLNKVLKDRNKINKSNQVKLNKLNRQVQNLEESLRHKQSNVSQFKSLELEIGDLNQELLLLNDNISQVEFKIKRKQQIVEELRVRVYSQHQLLQLGQSSSPQRNTSSAKKNIHVNFAEHHASREEPELFQKKMQRLSRSNPRYPPSSKNITQLGDLTHLTPTFPSNELELNSQPHKKTTSADRNQDTQAYKNIEVLIQRYEKIKKKDKVTE